MGEGLPKTPPFPPDVGEVLPHWGEKTSVHKSGEMEDPGGV